MDSGAQPPPEGTATVRPGQVLVGKYRVDRILGFGGMGVVVQAKHLELGQPVAIKFLRSDRPAGEDVVARFIREARAAARLQSEHVARVLDVGRLETGDPYMVLEYLEGSDLSQIISKSGPLSCGYAVDCVVQACAAVADAHALGIVHRDLKPANLFVTRRTDGSPFVKVLDFGISKFTQSGKADSFQGDLTQTAALMGSPLYMSPEQMNNSKDVDARSDIWALGGILFELLHGKPPFDSRTLSELCIKVSTQSPPSIRASRSDVPTDLKTRSTSVLKRIPRTAFRMWQSSLWRSAPLDPWRTSDSSAESSGSCALPGSRSALGKRRLPWVRLYHAVEPRRYLVHRPRARGSCRRRSGPAFVGDCLLGPSPLPSRCSS